MNIRPPEIKDQWDDNSEWVKCQLIAYEQIRGYEENTELEIIASGGRCLI